MEALRGHFRPEFLNRIDEIIIFDRLTAEELKGIVDIQLQRVRKRLEAKGLVPAHDSGGYGPGSGPRL